MKNPLLYDISWRSKFSNKEATKDKYIEVYRKYLSLGKPEYAEEMKVLQSDPEFRYHLECLLLSGCTNTECMEYFGCDSKAITLYKKIYFDIDPVKKSKARLLQIARSGNESELVLRVCSVKFGKEFIRWYLGMDETLNTEYIERMKTRLSDGILIKALGHEFSGSTSKEMNAYIKLINIVMRDIDKGDLGSSVNNIVGHFSKIFTGKIEDE